MPTAPACRYGARVSTLSDEAEQALRLMVSQQSDPRTACAYLGTEAGGILAELEDLEVPWQETLQVGVRDGKVVAATLTDHDEEIGRSWIHGPWAADDEAWEEHADRLVDDAVAATPDGVDDHELCADPANVRLAELARRRGWRAGVVNLAYVTRSDEGWPDASPDARAATPDDLGAITTLHDEAFPGTYATARRLLDDADRTTIVLERDGEVMGYASAEVQADGAGYLDFIALAPAARGQGLAKALLAQIGREILARSSTATLSLTVREDNRSAVALYESFGFVRDAELVGYRSGTAPTA